MKLTLRRAGTFKANWRTGDGVCGHGEPGAQEYLFVCEIVSDSEFLDGDGFIIDQLEVNQVFQEEFYPAPRSPLSCEKMALNFVDLIRRLVMNHAGVNAADRVTVGIGVIPPPGVRGEALISAEWVR
jgi:hypothetical protein